MCLLGGGVRGGGGKKAKEKSSSCSREGDDKNGAKLGDRDARVEGKSKLNVVGDQRDVKITRQLHLDYPSLVFRLN